MTETPTPNKDDELETIKEIMMMVARRCETISEVQQQNTYAIQDTRRDIELLTHRIERNSTAIERLTDRIDRIGDRIDRLATLQAQTELTLQQFIRHMDNEIRRIWEQIQTILSELRNRFPGNGKGD